MPSSASKPSYRDHKYSGKRGNKAKVRAGLKRHHHGEDISREVIWRKKCKVNPSEDATNKNMPCSSQQITSMKRPHGEDLSHEDLWRKKPKMDHNEDATCEDNIMSCSSKKAIRTYARNKPKYQTEAKFTDNCINSQDQPTQDQPTTSKSVEINWPTVDPSIESHQLTVERSLVDNMAGLSGRRIVDMKHVLKWAFRLEKHKSECENSVIEFIDEIREGFISIFIFKCSMCDKEFRQANEDGQDINKAFVWGTVTAGSYYTQAAHITNMMDIPTMSATYFRNVETSLGDVWKDHLTAQIEKVGQEEREIAIKKGHVNSEGIPYITVIVDGGWAKRSYGHDYNSSSGMACIIGKETKKCLYLGIKNKYCYHCYRYEKENKEVPPHTCFKNYEGPSTAMESSILVEGFQQSEDMHGLQYLSFIGDGDSSVFAQLRENVSYGQKIKKIECKNHVIKNYTSALYKILANTKLPLYGRKILKPKLKKLTTVSRKIIMTKQEDKSAMREDLKNGPLHVFGQHINCKEYYCKFVNEREKEDKNEVENLKKNAPTIWASICAANESVMAKTHRLSNETTNCAENLMSIISKFNCGKRINLTKSGSYQRRVYVAGLTQISGQNWHRDAWKTCAKKSPGVHVKKYLLRKEKSRLRMKNALRKRLYVNVVASKKTTDSHYGPKAQDVLDPIDDDELRKICSEKLSEFQKSVQEIECIERRTVGQHENDEYNMHRQDRLTASNFGMICKRRKSTACHNHVKSILYKNNILTKDMEYGKINESIARTYFIENYKKNVIESGLWIDEEYGFLGASPDGIVENEPAILEIKCFPSLARSNEDIQTAALQRKNFPLVVDDGVLKMNRNHNYFYQVQGQLRVTKMEKCYFVGFVSPSQPITVVEVERDNQFIADMVPKLVSFFKTYVLPEIVLRRVTKGGKCLEGITYE